ncbi:helix-hairpin-helix domain-containing protein [Chamaesiphon sp. VAR_69_metabat_338]|uniref:helix-hairpin-helix domain-containing protein n=1 Tax=Chamaesiphon sp. VAR_69_metabat_338 TaxID=2964704 RepID=UPI00286E734B|nr:helix-hairpin-helix domain-containing protein [Chamaesiphon sp. VAR_69_metabat_338]
MSNAALKRIPDWVWWSLCPVFGGLTIAYAGYTTKTERWLQIGGVLSAIALLAIFLDLSWLVYLAVPVQFAIAMNIKNPYLIKSAPRGAILPTDRQTAKSIASIRGKVDINRCSKDDLVHVLGLPIAYANNIELLKAEGYMFTHLEELTTLADVPEKYSQAIEPMIAFNYYEQSDDPIDWQRLNVLPISELIELGLDLNSAAVICTERQRNGAYRSLVEVKRRTGLPIALYKHLI